MAEKKVNQIILDRLLKTMEQDGKLLWQRDWLPSGWEFCIGANGKRYGFLNQLLLGKPGEYFTPFQINKLGGKIKENAKPEWAVSFWYTSKDKLDKDGEQVMDEEGNPVKILLPHMKYVYVYHIDNIEGIKPRYKQELPPDKTDVERREEIDDAIAAYCEREHIEVVHAEQNKAFYSPASDSITLPLSRQFKSAGGYYSTMLHEIVHSTGAKTRLDRFKRGGFGSKNYGSEELVAEIGAACLMGHFGVADDSTEHNSAAYLQNWLKSIRGGEADIMWAFRQAQRAVELVLGIKYEEQVADDVTPEYNPEEKKGA